jgi:hypothetical protein
MDKETEAVTGPSGRVYQVPITRTTFQPWAGAPVPTYGGKRIIDYGGRPLFAELGALERFCAEGWIGVWVDSFSRKYQDAMPPAAVDLPAERRATLDRIRAKSGRSGGGVWDLFLWRGADPLFVELKRARHDVVQNSQKGFLEAALDSSIPLDAFRLLEWRLA